MTAYQLTDRKCCMRRKTRLILAKRGINVQSPIPWFALSVPLLMPSISGITLFYAGGFLLKKINQDHFGCGLVPSWGGSLGVLTGNLFPELHRVLRSLAPGKVPGPKASPQLSPRLVFQGKSCPLCCLDAHWSMGGLAVDWASRQRATLRVKSALSQAASSLASLLNLKAKWTSCCGKPRCQCIQHSPAGEACQEAPQHCSCCLAEPLWHRKVSS